jgi:hypothetical protein
MEILSLDRVKQALDQLQDMTVDPNTVTTAIFKQIQEAIYQNNFGHIHAMRQLISSRHQALRQRQLELDHLSRSIQRELRNSKHKDYLPMVIENAGYSGPHMHEAAAAVATVHSLDSILNEYKQYMLDTLQIPDFDPINVKAVVLVFLSQELVIRSIPIDQHKAIATFLKAVSSKQHYEIQQMLWLPNHLMLLEETLVGIPRKDQFSHCDCKADRSGGILPNSYWNNLESILSSKSESTSALRECTQTEVYKRIITAPQSWDKSTGHIFEAQKPITASEVTPSLLSKCNAECFELTTHIGVQPLSLKEAYTQLFATAVVGPAYGPGTTCANGRYRTWKSLSGLCGAPREASVEEINALCEQCQWFGFSADGTWFHNVAWDLGLIALRPDGKTLALVAATSTD